MLKETYRFFSKLLNSGSEDEEMVKDIIAKIDKHYVGEYPGIDVYALCKAFGIRIVAIDYGKDMAQFIRRDSGKKSFIFINSTSDYRKSRFDIATLLYTAIHVRGNDNKVVTLSADNHSLHKAKRFARVLLMPMGLLKKELFKKNSKGEYIYLKPTGKANKYCIPFVNIHYIAEHFGVDFDTCATRIFNSEIVSIEGVSDLDELRDLIYTPDASEAKRNELVPEYKDNTYRLKKALFDRIHFPKIDTANKAYKEKLRVESIKNECMIEGVITDFKAMDKLIAKYRANPSEVKKTLYRMSVNQRIALGHYQTLVNLEKMEFDDSFFATLHENIFKYAVTTQEEIEWLETSKQYHPNDTIIEFIPGLYRNTANMVNGASFTTDNVETIYNTMKFICLDAKLLLEKKDDFSNSEYLNRVNYLADRFIVCHPFEDGNGRVSRLFINYMLMKKGITPFFINATTRKQDYITALNSFGDESRYSNMYDMDMEAINSVLIDSIIESEGYFYSASAMEENPIATINKVKESKANRIKFNPKR